MKRLLSIWVLGAGLGLTGCALEGAAPEEQLGQQGAELGTEGSEGSPQTNGAGSGTLGHPSDLVTAESGDPSGPTPYPWLHSDDPSGGPTPYPWDEDSEQTDSTGTTGTTSGTGTGSQTKTKSTN